MSRVEQPVEMHDEIAHLRIGAGVIRKHANDVQLVEVLEDVVLEIDQLAADDEVKQLLRGIVWHGRSSLGAARQADFSDGIGA